MQINKYWIAKVLNKELIEGFCAKRAYITQKTIYMYAIFAWNPSIIEGLLSLYTQECFTGKYTTCKIHTKPHPAFRWRIFHILTSEDIDDFTDFMFDP